ncbi:MAG TPA: hypothetical protein VE462_12875 [Propionibacteriaceae bacterium]|jgi:hypothetical protein|nr:hypothetical protein [Propionibacteriaceae bacterium]
MPISTPMTMSIGRLVGAGTVPFRFDAIVLSSGRATFVALRDRRDSRS